MPARAPAAGDARAGALVRVREAQAAAFLRRLYTTERCGFIMGSHVFLPAPPADAPIRSDSLQHHRRDPSPAPPLLRRPSSSHPSPSSRRSIEPPAHREAPTRLRLHRIHALPSRKATHQRLHPTSSSSSPVAPGPPTPPQQHAPYAPETAASSSLPATQFHQRLHPRPQSRTPPHDNLLPHTAPHRPAHCN